MPQEKVKTLYAESCFRRLATRNGVIGRLREVKDIRTPE